MRLMGGLAIWLRSESVRKPPFAREYADMDFAASSKGRAAAEGFLEGQGYVPEKLFNAIHGAQRLNYAEPNGRWTMDILIDELAMSHRLDLRGRLDGPQPTIPLADLVLTKLQIWEINRKDLGDVLCLLADHPLGKDGDGAIGLDRIGAVLGADWGFCHTAERNLGQGGRAVGRGAGGRRSLRRRAPGRGHRRRHRRRPKVARLEGARPRRRARALVRDARRGPALGFARVPPAPPPAPPRRSRAAAPYRNAASTSRPSTSMERGEAGPGHASRTILSTPARA